MTLNRMHHLIVLLVWLAAPAVCAADNLLYEQPSMFGSIVVTESDDGVRTLRFGRSGPRQSVVKPGDPDYLVLKYTQSAFAGLALADNPRRLLVIGVGGGTLPMFLRKHYPDAAIDAVDIDPQVIEVAREFLDFREDAALHAHAADGRAFIEAVREPYDVIFLDAFSSSEVPAHLTTREFLQAVRHALTPGGVVIGNVWDRYANRLYDSMLRTYQDVFDDVYILGVAGAGNKMFISLPRKIELSEEQFAARARKLSEDKGFRYDLGEAVKAGFTHARERNAAGRVLVDAKP